MVYETWLVPPLAHRGRVEVWCQPHLPGYQEQRGHPGLLVEEEVGQQLQVRHGHQQPRSHTGGWKRGVEVEATLQLHHAGELTFSSRVPCECWFLL